jgi:hypothetical protein
VLLLFRPSGPGVFRLGATDGRDRRAGHGPGAHLTGRCWRPKSGKLTQARLLWGAEGHVLIINYWSE